ncbi:MAG: cytochrome c [Dehalococcoidia bacterium]
MSASTTRASLLALSLALLTLIAAACSSGSDEESGGDAAATTTVTSAEAAAAAEGKVKGQPVAEFFQANCSACHGAKRQGGVGPELTPKKLTRDNAVYEDTILNGRSGTAMPAWSKTASLTPDDARALTLWLKVVAP